MTDAGLTLFLDDGGVISDNALRAPQWQTLVAAFFPPRLGGTSEAWAAANREIFPAVWDRFVKRHMNWDPRTRRYQDELDRYDVDWLSSMCGLVGLAPPADCLEVAREAVEYIQTRVRAAIPGAVEAVKALAARLPVYSASGGASYELARCFDAYEMTSCFRRLYGADLVNVPKWGPAYYEAIFRDAGVEPATALVVDSDAAVLGWARAAGARTVLVAPEGAGHDELAVPSLAALPALLDRGMR